MTGRGGEAPPLIDRDELLADRGLVGAVFCRAYARRVDEWLEALFNFHLGKWSGISLVALGGYGRSTLSPQSDLDVMLLHQGWSDDDLEAAAQLLWFPIWDSHIALGHSVRSIDQTLELAKGDLETATSLLSMRHIAGDRKLTDELGEQAMRQWRRHQRRWIPRLVEGARERARVNGEVAFLLEPDLKVSAGGLRDLHALRWMVLSDVAILDHERRDLRAANDTLLAARVELHRSTGRKGDRLLLEQQDGVAEALAKPDADVLMSEISSAARTVTWIGENLFHRSQRRLRRRRRLGRGRSRGVDRHIVSIEGTVRLTLNAPVDLDPTLVLRVAVAAAERGQRIGRDALDQLVGSSPDVETPWPPEVRDLFIRLLLCGHAAIPVIETLDQGGLLTRLLPEWEPTRSKVQRNQYHRFTVDRHLLEACAVACTLVDRVDRRDLLVVGALLHDIGKGYPGDHTEVGVELIPTIGHNMGFDGPDVEVLKRMCQHHLLLPDAATRRDIEDPQTIAAVAAEVETVEFLHLLAALTEADSIATGPSAWSAWKAHLVGELTYSTEQWLRTGGPSGSQNGFPDASLRAMFEANDRLVTGEGDMLTVISPDRPGLFARVAGAVALNDLNIIGGDTHVEGGKAIEVIRVVSADSDAEAIEWDAVVATVDETIRGTEDLRPRFEARAASRLVRPKTAPSPVEPVRVEFDNAISSTSTVIEVAGPDRLGLLYELSTVLADAGLDQQQTRVQTVGGDVVDAFYVQTLDGSKVTDPSIQADLDRLLRAVLEA